jgi:hypothetical protein
MSDLLQTQKMELTYKGTTCFVCITNFPGFLKIVLQINLLCCLKNKRIRTTVYRLSTDYEIIRRIGFFRSVMPLWMAGTS